MTSMLWIRKSLSIWRRKNSCVIENDEDAHRKFENYPLMETSPGEIRAFLEAHISRNIQQAKT